MNIKIYNMKQIVFYERLKIVYINFFSANKLKNLLHSAQYILLHVVLSVEGEWIFKTIENAY